MKKNTNRKGGFTIIEVVLVLAVAGLIFLVVFAAIPRLQASRRDNQRKRDAEALLSLAIEFESNVGRGLLWSEARDAANNGTGAFLDYWNSASFTRPEGGSYSITDPASNSPAVSELYYNRDAICSADGGTLTNAPGTQTSAYGVLVGLERGEYCVDNS